MHIHNYNQHSLLRENRSIYFDAPQPEPERVGNIEITENMTPDEIQEAQDIFMKSHENFLKQIDENIKRNTDSDKQKEWQNFRTRFESDWQKTASETVGKRQDKILAAYKKLQFFDEAANGREFEELYGKPKNADEFDKMLKEFEAEFTNGAPCLNRLIQLGTEVEIIKKLAKELGVNNEKAQERMGKLSRDIGMHTVWNIQVHAQLRSVFKENVKDITEEEIEEYFNRGGVSKYRESKEK